MEDTDDKKGVVEEQQNQAPEISTDNMYSFNIVIIGDSKVGKSEAIDCFLEKKFQSEFHAPLTSCNQSMKEFSVRIPDINTGGQTEIDQKV